MLPRRLFAIGCAFLILSAPLYGQSTPKELNDAGWKALRAGNPAKAAALFREALALAPDDPALLLGAGWAAHTQGRQREAMAHLERALQLEPELTDASRLLGDIAYAEGDADLAIRTYEAALKYAPSNRALAKQLDAWRRDEQIHHTFESTKYDRFRVMFEGRAEEALASQATAVLDTAFYRIGRTLGEFPPDTIVAILYTEQQFRDITRAPAWSGGQYDGRIRVPVAGASRDPRLFEQVLTHEMTHAFLAGMVPHGIPAWLNEGLAQYFDGTDPAGAQRRMKAIGRSIPLKNLTHGFGGMSAAAAQVAYDESLLAVSVMADRPGFGWVRLLHRLADGQSFEDAIVNFGFSYADLEAPFTK